MLTYERLDPVVETMGGLGGSDLGASVFTLSGPDLSDFGLGESVFTITGPCLAETDETLKAVDTGFLITLGIFAAVGLSAIVYAASRQPAR